MTMRYFNRNMMKKYKTKLKKWNELNKWKEWIEMKDRKKTKSSRKILRKSEES